jgi:hypothetical protein
LGLFFVNVWPNAWELIVRKVPRLEEAGNGKLKV